MYGNLQYEIQYFVLLRFSAISVKRFINRFSWSRARPNEFGFFSWRGVFRAIDHDTISNIVTSSSARVVGPDSLIKNYKRVRWILPILALVIITVKTGFTRMCSTFISDNFASKNNYKTKFSMVFLSKCTFQERSAAVVCECPLSALTRLIIDATIVMEYNENDT